MCCKIEKLEKCFSDVTWERFMFDLKIERNLTLLHVNVAYATNTFLYIINKIIMI